MDDVVHTNLHNVNIESQERLPTPEEIKKAHPITEDMSAVVNDGRHVVRNILDRKDHRLLVVVGPCSIHDIEAAKEYANRLKELADEVSDDLYLVMRVYFEKPRTTVGWKGLINDPHLNDTFNIEEGLGLAREILLYLASIGLPSGTEALDPITPQYLDDLISWTAIGARTTESQTHREMASGLSTPVGFKNGTDGSVQVAINALKSAGEPHRFLGINSQGQCTVMHTSGNKYGHVVLRGGSRPNYDSVSISLCEKQLSGSKLPDNIMIDCSHGNSLKDPTVQPLVLRNCVNQIANGNNSIIGLMVESNLHEGNQSIPSDLNSLQYGVSVTDGCLGWDDTVEIVRQAKAVAGSALRERMKR